MTSSSSHPRSSTSLAFRYASCTAVSRWSFCANSSRFSLLTSSTPIRCSDELFANFPSKSLWLASYTVSSKSAAALLFTSYSTFGLVGVQASEPYTRFARLACGSMASGPNTSEMGPYLLWPSCAFTTAIEGDGIPPSSSASFRFSSVRLCTATSSLVLPTSTGALSWNLTVFFTASSVLLLSSEVRAILCLEASGNLLAS